MDGCKILVIDNDPKALEVINDILFGSCSDLEIMNTTNGKSGFEIAQNERPDLVISDWEMPEMNGLKFIRKLQNNNELKHIPVIVCTGVMLETKHLQEALEAGAVDYIRKPINEIELLSRVKAMWRLTKLRNELIAEKEEHTQTKIIHLEEKIDQQTIELKSKALTLGRFNGLLKNISQELRVMNHKIQIETNNLQIEDLVSQINSNITNENWSEFQAGFEELHPEFTTRLFKKYRDLTKKDIKLCILIKLNLSTKEMAALLNQSIRSIEMARHRLRKKMNIDRNSSLTNELANI